MVRISSEEPWLGVKKTTHGDFLFIVGARSLKSSSWSNSHRMNTDQLFRSIWNIIDQWFR
jgi:hypothetical protein